MDKVDTKDNLGRKKPPISRVALYDKGSRIVASETLVFADGTFELSEGETPYDVVVTSLDVLEEVQQENAELRVALEGSFSSYMSCIADLLTGDYFTAPYSYNVYDYMHEQKATLYNRYTSERGRVSLLKQAKLDIAWDYFWGQEIPGDPFAHILVDAGSHYDERQCVIALERVRGLVNYAEQPTKWPVLKRALSIAVGKGRELHESYNTAYGGA